MAEAEGGIHLQLGDAVLEAGAGIVAKLDEVHQSVRDIYRLEEAYQQLGPVQLRLRAGGTSDASGSDFVVDLGGPGHGRVWEVRSLVIGGVTWKSVVAGSAEVYIAPAPSSSPPLGDLVDQVSSLPVRVFYSSGQVRLRFPERLYVVISSPTASTTYIAGGAGLELPDRPAPRVATE